LKYLVLNELKSKVPFKIVALFQGKHLLIESQDLNTQARRLLSSFKSILRLASPSHIC